MRSKDTRMASKKVAGKRFAVELRNVIDECYDGNMAEYCRASKVSSGTIGHYLSSNRYPGPERLDNLLRPLQGKWKMRLLESYLTDLVPANVRQHVKVQSGERKALKPVELDADMGVSEKTRCALGWLGRLAADNHAVRLMVEQTAKAMGWQG